VIETYETVIVWHLMTWSKYLFLSNRYFGYWYAHYF